MEISIQIKQNFLFNIIKETERKEIKLIDAGRTASEVNTGTIKCLYIYTYIYIFSGHMLYSM